jgi:hypothetical protein
MNTHIVGYTDGRVFVCVRCANAFMRLFWMALWSDDCDADCDECGKAL